MSLATTGVPAAKPSVSTMPKLSPPSDGATSRSALASGGVLALVGDLAERADAARVEHQRRDVLLAGADDTQLDGHVLAQRLEGAQQHRQALALDGLADEREPQRRGRRPGAFARIAAAGTSTPLGMTR